MFTCRVATPSRTSVFFVFVNGSNRCLEVPLLNGWRTGGTRESEAEVYLELEGFQR